MAYRNQRILGLQKVAPSDNTNDNTTIDIIAIHGLETGSPRTWEYRKKSGGREVNWIVDGDMLPAAVPEARIYTYDWDANCFEDAPVQTLLGHADNLLALVAGERASRDRPIIFVASCFGGLILAEAICRAAQEGSPYRHVLLSTVGAVFLATPFCGSDAAAQANWLVTVKGIVGEQSSDQLVRDLEEKHDFVRQRVQKFAEIANADSIRLPIRCFFETKKTELLRKLLSQGVAARLSSRHTHKILVAESSACLHGFPRQGLSTTHSGMNKFSGPEDPNFKSVRYSIQNLVQESSGILDHRKTDSSHGNLHWMISRPLNNLFTGRNELLLRIQKALLCDDTSSPKKQKRFVITGLGGQGKSEISLQVASIMREKFWGVFWVDVDKASTAKSDFIAIAKLLGRVAESVPDALQVLATTKQTWLLILDNADDPNSNYQDYIPSGSHGAVLMTSRISECKRYSPNAYELLKGLEDKDSKELLLTAADIPKGSWPSHSDQAEKVIRLLGSHTLAIVQAGAYIANGRCQLHQYPDVYRRQRKRLLGYQPEQAQSRYCDVYTTFEASADVLEQSKSEAATDALRLLEILSMLDSSILPLQIFQSTWDGAREITRKNGREASQMSDMSMPHLSRLPGFVGVDGDEWDPYRLIEASSLLVSLSLVTRHDLEDLSGLSIHPLTHAWAKDRQDSNQQVVAWIAAGSVLALSRSNARLWRTQERRLLPHVQSYLDMDISKAISSSSQAIVVPILFECGWALQRMRQDSRLNRFLEDIFIELDKSPEKPSKETLPLYDLQAENLINMGRHKKAVALLEQVVEIRGTTLAKDHPDRLASQHELAIAYRRNGQVKEAVALLKEVVEIQGTMQAKDHPDRLNSQHALAMAYQVNGQVKEAVALLKEVVEIRGTMQAKDHPDRLASQHVLAIAYRRNGQVKEAVTLLKEVVEIRGTMQAKDHPDRLASQHELAIAYEANGQAKEAVTLLKKVVEIQGTTLAKNHPDRLASQHALAMAYEANGQAKEAVTLLKKVVEIQGTTLAKNHPDRLASQHELAIAYRRNGQVKEAVALLKEVVEIRGTMQAKDHPDRLASQHVLAIAYRRNGQVKEAVALLEEVVQIEGTTLAEDHPDRLTSQHALAIAYQANGQVKEAVALFEAVAKIERRNTG